MASGKVRARKSSLRSPVKETGAVHSGSQPWLNTSNVREYSPGHLVIKFKSEPLGAVRAEALSAGPRSFAFRPTPKMTERVSEPLEFLRRNIGVKRVVPLLASEPNSDWVAKPFASIRSLAETPKGPAKGLIFISTDERKITPQLLKQLQSSDVIDFAERVPARFLTASRATGSKPMNQWQLTVIGWNNSMTARRQRSAVKVAVLDSGIDLRHPQLSTVIDTYDHGTFSAEDIVGHGTHVAGIIAAVAQASGINGIAACKLAVWKIFNDRPYRGVYYVDSETYLRALAAVADTDCSVVNLSIGGSISSQAEGILFKRLVDNEVLPIAAMGNEKLKGNPIEYPAAHSGVVAVGAIGQDGKICDFSNTGGHIALVAPGQSIWSTVPLRRSKGRKDTHYACWHGTSMAAPHVSGAAALFLAKNPKSSARVLGKALAKGVKWRPDMRKAGRSVYGTGVLYLPKLLV